MAARRAEFTAAVSAEDDASKVLDDIADKGEEIERSPIEVKVDADTSEVDELDRKLDPLTDADKIVVLAVRAGAAQTELAELATDLATIEASDPSIDIKVEQFAKVSGELDQIETKIRDIADTSIDPDVGNVAKGKLEGIAESSGKAQGAVHSLAGNAVGDFAATTAGIGPLGEAVAQLTEGVLEGEIGMKNLAVAGLGVAGLSGGMILLNKIMGEFEASAKRTAELKAFNADQVKAYTEALREGETAADALVKKIEAAGEATFQVTSSLDSFGGGWRATADLTDVFARNGVTIAQFATAVTGGRDEVDRFEAALRQAGVSGDDVTAIISAARNETVNYSTAQERSARLTSILASSTEQLAVAGDAARVALAGAATAVGDVAAETARADTALAGLAGSATGIGEVAAAAERAETGMSALAGAVDGVTEANEEAATAAQKHADELNDLVDASVTAADSSLGLIKAQQDYNEASAASREAVKKHGAASAEATAAFERERDTAISLAKAALRMGEDQATASGQTLSAKQRIDLLNASLIESARNATPAAQAAILSYIGQVNQIPPEKATEIQALIEQGKFDEAKAQLDTLSNPQSPPVTPFVSQTALNALGGAVAGAVSGPFEVSFRAVGLSALAAAVAGAVSNPVLVRVNGGGTP